MTGLGAPPPVMVVATTVVAPMASVAERRARLRGLVAVQLALPVEAVRILHADGRAPRILAPAGSGLHLSSASRAGYGAIAVAPHPVGIDIEWVEPGLDPPWGVLHPDEIADLYALAPDARPRAFASVWAAKEAYLKARGTGLAREPGAIRVRLSGASRAVVEEGGRWVADLSWHGHGGDLVVATLLMPMTIFR